MAISSLGIGSGIDFDNIISRLITTEGRPLVKLREDQIKDELKSAAILNLKTKLSSFESAAKSLNSLSQFSTRNASITKTTNGEELLSVTASETATVGNTSIKVMQLAESNKKASQGIADQDITAIASSAGTFKFKVGSSGSETTVTVGSTTTLEQFRDAINDAGAGVTASIINDGTGSNSYRLVLNSNSSGTANNIILTNNDTTLDFENKKIEDAYAFTTNSYSGTTASNSSGTYTGSTNKSFLVEVVDITGGSPSSGTVKYKYSIDGGVSFLGANGAAYDGTNGVAIAADATLQNIDGQIDASTTTEGAKISFTGGTFALGDKFSIDVFNPEMLEAKDAVIEVDNATITKSSNKIDDVIQGVTLDLIKADTSSTVTLSVLSDTSDVKDNIIDFVDSYNVLNEFLDEQFSFDLDSGEASPLLGDSTLQTIRRRIANIVTGTIPGVSSDGFNNLSSIGITSNFETGALSVDNAKLDSALSKDANGVAKLFVGLATPSDSTITFESKTVKTQPGRYSVTVATAPEQATIIGDTDLSSTGLTSDEKLVFMVSKNHTDNSPDFTTFSVILGKGATINTIVNDLNSAFATNDVGLSASNDGSGKLKITSADYGEDIFLQVSSNKDNTDGKVQIFGDTNGIDGETKSDNGVDIVGTINNHLAVGIGNVLTGAAGFAEEGLVISTKSSTTGGKGFVTVSSGMADQLSNVLSAFTNDTDGLLKTKTDSIQKNIDNIKERQDKIEQKLIDKEEKLRAQFTRLETLISEFKSVGDFLTAQLGNLPKIGQS